MPMTASSATSLCQAFKPSGNKVMATRKQPYAPNFITTPANNIEAAVGAATWPVGAQVCKGHNPARMAKPTNTSGKAQYWKGSGKAKLANSTKLVLFAPALTYA